MNNLHPIFQRIFEMHGAPRVASKTTTVAVETTPDTYRGWTISYDPPPIPIRDFDWCGTGPNFDASWECEEDGYVSNGEQVFARTRTGLIDEIDAWFMSRSAE